MKRPHSPIRSFGRFLRTQEGSAIPLVGLAVMTLLASAGISIDMGRIQVVQSRMANALDAAGLAAGSSISTTEINSEVNKYYYANFPAGFMGTTIDSLTAVPNADSSLIVLDVKGHVPTTFMHLFGKDTVAVSAHAEITRASKGMELVLVMDTTGSMSDSAGGGQTKIQAARSAATSLVNILYGDKTTIDDLWVGMVPFAQAVNIGSSRTSWTSGTFNWGTTSWMGCVDAREGSNRDTTDDPPSVALFPKYYWPDDSNNNWIGTSSSSSASNSTVCGPTSSNTCKCTSSGGSQNCSCSTSTSGSVTTQVCIACSGSGSSKKCTRTTTVTTTTTTYTINSTHGPNLYCSQAITPLSANKNTVLNAITTLSPDGNTHIVLGAAWAWRMLSPRWQELWGGDMDLYDLPLDYNTNLMNKVVVLMTDGDNTISSSVHGAYWYLSDGHLGTTNSTAAVTQLNNRLQSVCTSMKNHDIIIYTIAFGTGISTTAQNMLRDCASKPEYYFYSPTGAALQTAFHQIGDSLANLRISK